MLRGKGMWIWQVRACERGDVGAITARAVSAGLTHVLVKIADGRAAYNGDLGPLVRALRGAGIDVWAWQYTYGTHPEAEAQFAATRYRECPYAGFVVDAEGEYEQAGGAARAASYMEALRAALPDTTVALSSYYLPALHGKFPWREFASRCDLIMPQVYWHGRGPTDALRGSLQQNAQFGKPIFPTGAAYMPGCRDPIEIILFCEQVRATHLAGANFWSWQHATDEMWGIIARASVGGEAIGMAHLADVARTAKAQDWMRRSYATDSEDRIHYLTSSSGYCMAYAGEILAHAFEPEAGANRRFSQKNFTFAFVKANADAWGDFLANDGDQGIGPWLTMPPASSLRPGDMLFWRAGVRGYKYSAGHVAIVTDIIDGRVIVSENSSIRGIGVRAIDSSALAQVAGAKRWAVPGTQSWPEEVTLVALPGWERNVRARMIDDSYWVRARDLPGLMGGKLDASHVFDQHKLYITEPEED